MDRDFRDLLSAFGAAKARYLVVGGYAVGVHGRPRATKDLDIWVEASKGNARRVIAALKRFGAPLWDVSEEDFAVPGAGLMMGVPPLRIDILTRIDGVRFADAWRRRTFAHFDDVVSSVIGLEDLLANKRASGRPQDLADVEALERLAKLKQKAAVTSRSRSGHQGATTRPARPRRRPTGRGG